jgi:hypothetical protein
MWRALIDGAAPQSRRLYSIDFLVLKVGDPLDELVIERVIERVWPWRRPRR